jgi:hypothetical protein
MEVRKIDIYNAPLTVWKVIPFAVFAGAGYLAPAFNACYVRDESLRRFKGNVDADGDFWIHSNPAAASGWLLLICHGSYGWLVVAIGSLLVPSFGGSYFMAGAMFIGLGGMINGIFSPQPNK